MFPPLYVAAAFALMLTPGFVFGVEKKWLPEIAKRTVVVIGAIAAIYVFAAGASLYSGWDEWMASRPGATNEDVGHVRRGGIILLFITYLPYALMGLSAYILYFLRYPIVRMAKGQKV